MVSNVCAQNSGYEANLECVCRKAPGNITNKTIVAEPMPMISNRVGSGIMAPSNSSPAPYSRNAHIPTTTPSRNAPTPTSSYNRTTHRRTPSVSTYAPAPTQASLPTDPVSRRLRRYALAEGALARSLAPHTDASPIPLEVQIRALEQATVVLALHAEEARARVAQLKEVNRENEEPKAWELIQQERWLVEKRRTLVENEVKAVNEHLTSLKRFGGKSRKATAAPALRKGGKDKGAAPAKQELPAKPTEEQARKEANLLRFFELSPTRAPISHASRRKRAAFNSSICDRRVTMNSSSPMRLRSTIVATFSPYGPTLPPQKPAVHQSRASTPVSPTIEESTVRNLSQAKPVRQPSMTVVEETEDVPLTEAPLLSKPVEPPVPVSHVVSEPLPQPQPKAPTSPGRGFATISTPKFVPRSKADILAGAREAVNEHVEIPSYALELMGDFGRDLGEDVSMHATAISPEDESTKPKAKNSRPLSLGSIPTRTRSLLRKPSLAGARKSRVSVDANRPRPLLNLFSIAETAPIQAGRDDRSAPVLTLSITAHQLNLGMGIDAGGETEPIDQPRALPFPNQDSPISRPSDVSSFEMVMHPSSEVLVKTPSKLRRHFSFLSRK